MSSAEILLRQKCLLSVFTTTVLITLTTQSSLAFNIAPPPFLPFGATELWDPEESYNFANEGRGTVTLSPTKVGNITRGGSAEFLRILKLNFPGWKFTGASRDLSGSFKVKTYNAVTVVDNVKVVGAELDLEYIPGAGDPTPQANKIHWIQRIVDNHNLTNNPGHGNHEDTIDRRFLQLSPYYDIYGGRPPKTEGTFYDLSARPDTDKNHNWLAELYLVEETAPTQVTIYNGIKWGWQNRVESVPEPLTIFAAGISLGFGVLFRKTVKETEQNKIK